MTDEEIAKLLKELAEANRAKAEAEGKSAANAMLAEQARADAKKAEADLPAKIAARVSLEAESKRVHPEVKCDGKTDAEVMRDVVAKLSPTLRVDGDDALKGAFLALVGSWDGGRKEAEKAIVSASNEVKKDSNTESVSLVQAARERNYKRAALMFGMSDTEIRDAERKLQTQAYESALGVKGN